MKKLAVLLLMVSALSAGCAADGTPDRAADREQGKPQQPVDKNRNGVPDPLEPVIVRPPGAAG